MTFNVVFEVNTFEIPYSDALLETEVMSRNASFFLPLLASRRLKCIKLKLELIFGEIHSLYVYMMLTERTGVNVCTYFLVARSRLFFIQ